jgi:glutathione peroxidase
MSIHEYKVLDIKKNEIDLSKYKDKVVLIVNVASKCNQKLF